MLSFASLSFDVGVEELFCPLSHGAATVIDPGVAEEPARFLGRCRDRGITVLSVPTAYWHTLATALGEADGAAPPLPPAVRLTILGGERALPERWAAWGRGAGAHTRTLNCYGPTEATIAASALEHPGPGLGEVRREVPIGRPYPGVLAYVLDADPSGWSEPVPIGGLGELSLGGRGLARGYHHQPAATAAAFVPDPFAGWPGRWSGETRLYRTGDLVRRLADGAIEFSGRADAQVKVRGYRVEPGEIEAVLASHPAVGDAAVVAPEGPGGERRLVAFAVPRNGMDGAAFTAELADFLARRLPPYLVPSAVLALDSLPLTAAAKVDRRALADLAASRGSGTEYVPPGNANEEELAAIWQELLGVERVGAGDDFFALGGHSLLATRLASRLRGHFGVEISLPTLFERRRLADLAQEVLRLRLAKAEEGGVEDLLAELDGLSDEEALALLEREAGAAPAQETV
jgi:acyl-coenzyme A synthetase/AMP-(fatty) acid ligase/acyl carrier protein